MNSLPNNELAFLVGRIALGVNFFTHGFVRLPKITEFCEGMVKSFQETMIGFDPLIYGFAFTLIFVELLTGLALIVGFKTRTSLIIIGVVLMSLIFGSGMQEKWDVVGSQITYVVLVFLLINGYTPTKYSVDGNRILTKSDA